jgi:carboxyl-terminal processing protease
MKPNFSIKKGILIVSISFLISICSFSQSNNPILNYNHFVNSLNNHYGLFPYKNINWDSLTTYYYQHISDETSPDTLFFTLSRLASGLRDKHLWIDNEKYAYNYSIGKVVLTTQMDSIFASRRIYKNINLIKSKYLNNEFYSSEINNLLVGKISPKIGYLSLDWFDSNLSKTDSVVSNTLNFLSGCNYLIIDIRNNIGGTDSSALAFANYFVRTKYCYQISKTRIGIDADTYSDPIYWKTTPKNLSFSKKIIVLINRYSISAAETFSLALKNQPHIKFLGEPSAGAFSDAEDEFLPNGWHFSYSIGVWTDCNGILWEEIGIQPDIKLVIDDKGTSNTDKFIEQAIIVFRNDLF